MTDSQLDAYERTLDAAVPRGGMTIVEAVVKALDVGRPELNDEVAGWLARTMYISPEEKDTPGCLRRNEQIAVGVANTLIRLSRAAGDDALRHLRAFTGFLGEVGSVAHSIVLVTYPQGKAKKSIIRESALRTIEHAMSMALRRDLPEAQHAHIRDSMEKFQNEHADTFGTFRSYPGLSRAERAQHRELHTYPIDEEVSRGIIEHHRRIRVSQYAKRRLAFWRERNVELQRLDGAPPADIWKTMARFLHEEDAAHEAAEILAVAWDADPDRWTTYIRSRLFTGKSDDYAMKSELLGQLFDVWNEAQRQETEWYERIDYMRLEAEHLHVVFRISHDIRDMLSDFLKTERNYWAREQAAAFLHTARSHLGENEDSDYSFRDDREAFGQVPWFRVDPLRFGRWSHDGHLLLSAPDIATRNAFERDMQEFLSAARSVDELGFVSIRETDATGTREELASRYCRFPLSSKEGRVSRELPHLSAADIRGIELLLMNKDDILAAFGNLDISSRPLAEQIYFLRYLQPLEVPDVMETQRFLRAYGTDGFRAFMAAHDEPDFAHELIWHGNLLLEGVMADGDPLFKEILAAYCRVLDAADIARDVYRNRWGKEMTGEEFEKVGAGLRERATLVLKKAVRGILGDTDKSSAGSESVPVERIRKELAQIEADIVATTAIARELKLDPVTAQGSSAGFIPGPALKGMMSKALAIQEAQYENRPISFKNAVSEALHGAFANPDTEFFTIQVPPDSSRPEEKDLAGLFRLDTVKNNAGEVDYVHFASMLVNPKYTGARMMVTHARTALSERARNTLIKAECFPSGADITHEYMEWGFVATGVTDSLQMDLLQIEWNSKRNARLETTSEKMSKEEVVRRAGAIVPRGKTAHVRYAAHAAAPDFKTLIKPGYVLTRYFKSSLGGKTTYYTVLERDPLARKTSTRPTSR